ncbi:metal-dependent hydrolase [Candidatus Pantoea edessiphila]|uniref:Metal-dependent hydrolase n=1 Tax=Candidatus Pantoea edessiphila TaxID=2044610 RepID=A0A2P5SYY7_9GAMM|nr:YchF/TatD family DNA exonuclease [Candidatus Pantoea edessiphila]MBK4775355.1 YchF/TatD family DNA exonuclease [Pantoea sp. Edef]PPI87512.1 metal-dependent hydrolase [Candidatus Pantoea edessiphila]
MFIIDSHCHLNLLNYKKNHRNIDDVIKKAFERDIKFMLAVSTDLSDFYNLKKLVGQRKNISLSCGVHPLNKPELYKVDDISSAASDPKVIALGETGLDYHYKKYNKIHQQTSFRNHIRIGISLNKPLIVHMRDAVVDTLSILKEEKSEICGGVLHCFSENEITASKLLDLGFYISFSGIVTFNKIKNLDNVIRYVPIDRILVETDSPYLSPVPYRGQENQPAYTRVIAEYIAMLKNIDVGILSEETTNNFSKLFRIPISYLSNLS